MKHNFTLAHAIEGYTLSIQARHLSAHTIADYTRTLQLLHNFLPPGVLVNDITARDIERFMASFQNVSNKTLLNYFIGMSAFWSWMVREDVTDTHILRLLPKPRPEKREVIPFTETEVKALLGGLNRSMTFRRGNEPVTSFALSTTDRNRSILLLLLDTGIRAQELCDLRLIDVDRRNNRIQVFGKGAKERSMPFSPRTGQALWRYMAQRHEARPEDPIFITKDRRPLTRTKLAEMLRKLGARSGVKNVYPHRFRHTFAIQYLRNSGDPYTLQALLGHATMEMVRYYIRLAQVDLELAHRRASPVDNWRL